MALRTLLIINSALAFLSGIACVLLPAGLVANYGISLSSMGLVIYQFWGASLIGIGILTWIVRNIQDLVLQRSIAYGLFFIHGINSILAIKGQYAGANDFGWSNVALFSLLSFGFAYFGFIKLRKMSK